MSTSPGQGSYNRIEVDGQFYMVFGESDAGTYRSRVNVRTSDDEIIGYVGRTKDRNRGQRVWDAILPDGTVVSRFWRYRHEAIGALVRAPR